MGRKNRRLGNKELGPDVIKRILADNKPASHVAKTVHRAEGMRAEAVIIDDPARSSAADRQYHHARKACDRILAELDQELRSDHHVRSR